MSKAPANAPAAAPATPTKKLVTFRGVVDSDKRHQTRTVIVHFQAKHPKYGKYLREQTVLQVHDEKNASKQGDTVIVEPCRRMSKTKTWRIQRIVESRPKA
jgi:small subunit ribosomal protein S17